MTQLLTLISLKGFASMLIAELLEPYCAPFTSYWTCARHICVIFSINSIYWQNLPFAGSEWHCRTSPGCRTTGRTRWSRASHYATRRSTQKSLRTFYFRNKIADFSQTEVNFYFSALSTPFVVAYHKWHSQRVSEQHAGKSKQNWFHNS